MSDVMYNRQAFEAAHARLKRTPALLTDEDVEQLSMFDPALAQQGIERRFKALHPDPAPVPRQAPAARLDVDEIADTLITIIAANFRPLVAQLEAQQQRIAALEARPAVKYFGTHNDGTSYTEGSMTTRSGGLWVATRATTETPGTDDSGWKLIVKKGTA